MTAVTVSACFVGRQEEVLDEVYARAVDAWASEESAPRRGRGASWNGGLFGRWRCPVVGRGVSPVST